MKKKRKSINPWLMPYLCLAMICCIVISTVFLYFNYANLRQKEMVYNKEKLALVVDDLEKQLELFEDMGLYISINNCYKPYYFQRNKYYEQVLLEDLVKYTNYSPLTKEYFLYYKDSPMIFCSNKSTSNLDLFLAELLQVDGKEVKRQLEHLEKDCIYPVNECIVLILPLKISAAREYDAALCVLFQIENVLARIQTVSGGLDGDFVLYANNQILYNSVETDAEVREKDILHCEGEKGIFSLLYIPPESAYNTILLPLQIALIIVIIIFILFVASLFAWHSWKPLELLARKYRRTLLDDEEIYFSDALEEINHILESVVSSNTEMNTLLEEKQSQLRNQMLALLLEGKYSFDPYPYLEQVGLVFPEPYYFVLNVFFEEDDLITEDMVKLLELFEGNSDVSEGIYIYSFVNAERKMICNLCNVSERMQWEQVRKEICELSETYGNKTKIGCSTIYDSLKKFSAAYLEASDNIHKKSDDLKKNISEGTLTKGNGQAFCQITGALINRRESQAIEALKDYIGMLKREANSVLIQQYMFSSFFSDMNSFFQKNQVELSKQQMSLMVSARNIEEFAQIAEDMIHEFLRQVNKQQEQVLAEESLRIYEYVNEHFMDYEISIENVAREFKTNVMDVRNAIKEHSGKSYKDYIVNLRMEYAKELLEKQDLTVAEVGERIGYGNISYFIKLFKGYTGVTPASYKKLTQEW